MGNESAAGDMAGKYEQERQRLAKLWDAYEKQEKELAALKEKVGHLENDLMDRERIIKSLKDVLESRDRRTRELEIEMTSLRGDKSGWEPRLKSLETDLRLERERFAKLFALAEELEEEVKLVRASRGRPGRRRGRFRPGGVLAARGPASGRAPGASTECQKEGQTARGAETPPR